MSNHSELLVGLSVEELEALADSLLAPAAQAHLDDLLARQKESRLSAAEGRELDGLLQKVDHLTILKTRASTLCNKKGRPRLRHDRVVSQQVIRVR
jgi:hypothetical protein